MISFYLDDQPIHTTEPAASALLDFVRYHEHLTGTEIGCYEGDCGACTVLVRDRIGYYDTKAVEQLGVLPSEDDLFPYRQPSCAPPNRPAC